MSVKLIADSGATKCEWVLLHKGKTKKIRTQGISPYFLSPEQIVELLDQQVKRKLKDVNVDEIFYYGTGIRNPENLRIVRSSFKKVFPKSKIEVNDDMLAAARSLNGHNPGIACNLGTGSFSLFYNGKKIVKEVMGQGYVLGDEGSGAYLGKKVLQYFLYNTFDEELMARFNAKYHTNRAEILDNVYKKPFPSRYLASFAMFLAENRGHYMIENIIEDGLNDFIFNHLYKYRQSWTHPVNFVGSIAFGFRDVLKELCASYELETGKIIKDPMPGLVAFHRS